MLTESLRISALGRKPFQVELVRNFGYPNGMDAPPPTTGGNKKLILEEDSVFLANQRSHRETYYSRY